MKTRDNELFLQAMGERIADARRSKRLTLKALADQTDMSQAGLHQIEHGKSEPGASTLWRLSRALGVTIDYLVKGE